MMSLRLLFGAWVILIGAVGCEREASTPTVAPATAPAAARASVSPATALVLSPHVDPAERDARCPRLVSAAPNVTEMIAALGLLDHLVGRTRYCTFPPAVERIPVIGALNELNAELLLTLKPECILVSGASRAVTDRLRRLDVRFEQLPDTRLDDLFASLEQIGAITARPQTAAQVTSRIREQLAAAAKRHQGGAAARVLVLTSPLSDPPSDVDFAGVGSFYDDLLALGGHRSALPETRKAFATASIESVLAADPDVIIELSPDGRDRPDGDASALAAWARVGPIKAVKDRRVHVIVGPEYFLLSPRIADTAEALLGAVSGESR